MAASADVKKIYLQVVQDVCAQVREALSEEGYDDQTITELRTQWTHKIESSKALEPLLISATEEATSRSNRHSTTHGNASNRVAANARSGTTNPSVVTSGTMNPPFMSQANINMGTVTMGNATGATFMRPGVFNLAQNQPTMGNNTMRTSNQLDGTNDNDVIVKENTSKRVNRKKKSRNVEITFQLDGTGAPPGSDDEEDDDDNDIEGNDAGEDLDDDDDDDGNEEGTEDSRPLCSEDDVSEDEPAELFETDNVVVCQYDKISRTKNKWRFTLKSGVMNINGRDFVFTKANGEADW